MRQPSLSDILCVLVIAGIVVYFLSNPLTIAALVVAMVSAVLLILVIRWALGGARL
jgi:heme A synthase